ncbi:MAG: ABC transporter ATP-binding protein [Rhodobacteraceae bacterium]|nr:MAG: ABC transporter ATP-binding protein [Paracoccaceae bacterium]
MLEVEDLSKIYQLETRSKPVRFLREWFTTLPDHQPRLHAVDGVSFSIAPGESLGLVGESGCGKSTLVTMLVRLSTVTAGTIRFEGRDIGAIPPAEFGRSPDRAKIQVVFQDPHESLNPRDTAFDTIAEPLKRLLRLTDAREIAARVGEAAERVGLPAALLSRYPHQLSGGQKARVNIARAIAPGPRLLVLDEPTSALDVSVQAVILKLLDRLRRELGMSYLFVSHDLNVVRLLCDRVMVMYLGKVAEIGPTEAIFEAPQHPYTRALLSAAPGAEPAGGRIRLDGEPRSPVDPDPNVCRFFGRCPQGHGLCERQAPALRGVGPSHAAACHLAAAAEAAA